VLRDVFGAEREEVTGDWRRLHNEELHDFNWSPNITREITSSCVRWVGHVACMGRRKMYTEFWWGKLKERHYLKKQGITDRIILKCTIKSWEGVDWINLAQNSENGSLFC
jgi:hypothetical protein